VRELKLDVILLDVRMPGMDGRAVLMEIRKLPGFELVPVIAVTASSLAAEETELKQQFSGYVRKPFSKQELFDELAQFLPAHVEASPEPPAADAAAASGADLVPPPGASPELLVELRRLKVENWPAIRDSVAVNESKAFGRKLEELGQRWGSAPLVTYAQILVNHAEQYAVADLEKHLAQFGDFVERLDHPMPK
jgi:response regulator RpfG family c-di-GMP phosphodiesterase